MPSQNKIHLEFGAPEHGWLPTRFSYNDFNLELDISDVPVDPMVLLCDALIEITKGIQEPGPILWHLEPYCYYLQLNKTDTGYKASVLESDQFDGPARLAKEITGTFVEIILPLYRSLRAFWSKSYKPPHWEELDPNRIKILTELIGVIK